MFQMQKVILSIFMENEVFVSLGLNKDYFEWQRN